MKMLIAGGKTVLAGNDAQAILEALREHSRSPCEGLGEFMAAVAIRAREQTGRPIRARPAEALVDDLCAAGLLERAQ